MLCVLYVVADGIFLSSNVKSVLKTRVVAHISCKILILWHTFPYLYRDSFKIHPNILIHLKIYSFFASMLSVMGAFLAFILQQMSSGDKFILIFKVLNLKSNIDAGIIYAVSWFMRRRKLDLWKILLFLSEKNSNITHFVNFTRHVVINHSITVKFLPWRVLTFFILVARLSYTSRS